MVTDQIPTWSTLKVQRPGAGSPILLATTDARCLPQDRTFIVIQGIQSWIEPFEMQRFALIASVLRARLIVVEVPGFGVAGSRLLPAERRALWAGDFGPLAARMFDAAHEIFDDTDREEPVSFLGYSLGASVAAAMANVAARQGRTVDRLVLVEPVALQRRGLLELITATRREARFVADSLAANDAEHGVLRPWDRRPGVRPATHRLRDVLVLGAALRCGGLADELRTVRGCLHQVTVVTADQSALSQADFSSTVALLRLSGVTTHEISVPGYHAFWHSLPAVRNLTRRLAATLNSLHV